MCQLHIQPHLFNPLEKHVVDIEPNQSLDQILSDITPLHIPGTTQPLIARVNGKNIDPLEWGIVEIAEGDLVILSPRPFGLETIALIALSVGTAAYSYIQMRKMKGLQKDYRDLPEQSPTYDTNAQGLSLIHI